LKHSSRSSFSARRALCSIHPQGWVPIETILSGADRERHHFRSIHPQGWVPIETSTKAALKRRVPSVAFTPKGGCPLKRYGVYRYWELIVRVIRVAFTPKGGCPLKRESSPPPVPFEQPQ